MSKLFDYSFYAQKFLKIQTKTSGLCSFKFRKYQHKVTEVVRLIEEKKQPVRILCVKARQCGFSTWVASKFSHLMGTKKNFKTIMLADKSGRTDEVFNIYDTFKNNLDPLIKPMVAVENTREFLYDNPKPNMRALCPGLASGLKSETAMDPNAGRSGTRRAAHLTEYGFYSYADQVNEGVQNSVPLAPETYIIKESTANGMTGRGENLFKEWEAAIRGESIYIPFFVSWFEVDDYAIDPGLGFVATKIEREILKKCPDVTTANLYWRRLKLLEYQSGKQSIFTPDERFCQDFPSFPEEAFLNSGRPVFNQQRLQREIRELNQYPHPRPTVRVESKFLAMYQERLIIFKIPEKGKQYVIGADVAEGVETGDFSSAYVMSKEREQCAVWHGHVDSDIFGNLLVELAKVYNSALIVPEVNNMGIATLNKIKELEYFIVFMRSVYDEIADKATDKMGWRTTSANKMAMLSDFAAAYRDGHNKIFDPHLLSEMISLTFESDGNVELTGRDRVVAACLAEQGLSQIYEAGTVYNPNRKERLHFERKDLSGEKIRGGGKHIN